MKKMMNDKKGVFSQLSGLGIGLASVAITLVVVFLILATLGSNTQVAADGNATAAVTAVTDAAESIPSWLPIVVIVAIGALLFLMLRGFGK